MRHSLPCPPARTTARTTGESRADLRCLAFITPDMLGVVLQPPARRLFLQCSSCKRPARRMNSDAAFQLAVSSVALRLVTYGPLFAAQVGPVSGLAMVNARGNAPVAQWIEQPPPKGQVG